MPRLAVLAAAAVVVIAGCATTSQIEDLEERVAQLEAETAANPERRTLTAEIVAIVYRTSHQTDPPSCIGVDTNHNELTNDSLLAIGHPVDILNSIDEVIAVTEIETATIHETGSNSRCILTFTTQIPATENLYKIHTGGTIWQLDRPNLENNNWKAKLNYG